MDASTKKLMAIFAHPDDESLLMGGALAKYAAEGVEVSLLMATRGERGRFGLHKVHPGMEVVGPAREKELLAAAARLGIKEVSFLDYIDGDLDKADPEEAIKKIALHIRRVKPQVVVTFGPDGAYGHPDHVAISQFATAAMVKAADANFLTAAYRPHATSKLYYIAWPDYKWELYQATLKTLTSTVEGVKRSVTTFPEWAITASIDASAYWQDAWEAIQCHRTQMEIYGPLAEVTEEQHKALWGDQQFYRAFSLVNGGRQKETDLFEGIAIQSAEKATPIYKTKAG